jgi:hypothetical protein
MKPVSLGYAVRSRLSGSSLKLIQVLLEANEDVSNLLPQVG